MLLQWYRKAIKFSCDSQKAASSYWHCGIIHTGQGSNEYTEAFMPSWRTAMTVNYGSQFYYILVYNIICNLIRTQLQWHHSQRYSMYISGNLNTFLMWLLPYLSFLFLFSCHQCFCCFIQLGSSENYQCVVDLKDGTFLISSWMSFKGGLRMVLKEHKIIDLYLDLRILFGSIFVTIIIRNNNIMAVFQTGK